jgi:WD40 repeat protein
MNSIDFSWDGALLVTASDDESIHVYDQHVGEYGIY